MDLLNHGINKKTIIFIFHKTFLQILETKRKTMINIEKPIEISSLCFHFLNQNVGNKVKAVITGKRHREIGLVVPAKLVFLTDDRRCAEVLEKELIIRREEKNFQSSL